MYYSTPHFYKCKFVHFEFGLFGQQWVIIRYIMPEIEIPCLILIHKKNFWYKIIGIFIQFYICNTLFWLSDCFCYISQTAKSIQQESESFIIESPLSECNHFLLYKTQTNVLKTCDTNRYHFISLDIFNCCYKGTKCQD